MEGFKSGFVSYERSSNELLYDESKFSSGQSKRVGRGDSSTTTDAGILLELQKESYNQNIKIHATINDPSNWEEMARIKQTILDTNFIFINMGVKLSLDAADGKVKTKINLEMVE
jgi:hypothetical protein